MTPEHELKIAINKFVEAKLKVGELLEDILDNVQDLVDNQTDEIYNRGV